MFDWLKRRMHKNDDLDDIRSNVLGERFDEPLKRFDSDLEDPLKKLSDNRFDEPPPFNEPPGFNNIDTHAPQRANNDRYDIIDRLNLIESQLSAIRSQTETINERLKNLDAKIGLRRY